MKKTITALERHCLFVGGGFFDFGMTQQLQRLGLGVLSVSFLVPTSQRPKAEDQGE